MQYELTVHAKKRIEERRVLKSLIIESLVKPTKISRDKQGVLLFKKLYLRAGKSRLLIVAGQFVGKKFKIFTVIDSSKISKYL